MENLAAVNERGANCLILAGLHTFEKQKHKHANSGVKVV